jgi:hypothetical protein
MESLNVLKQVVRTELLDFKGLSTIAWRRMGEWKYISMQYWSERTPSRTRRFILKEGASLPVPIGLAGLAGLDTVQKRKSLAPCSGRHACS